MDLLKRQEELQKEGKELLEKAKILEFLSQFGQIEIGGSMDSGLMVWPDIDLGVISEELSEENYWKMVKFFYGLNNYYHSLYIQDFRESVNPRSPKGLYIGIKIKFHEKMWKVDVWYIQPRREGEKNPNDWIKEGLNDDNRKIILEIKNQVWQDPKYRKEFFSVDIYEAVFKHGVKDLEDFKKYLADHNKPLS